MAIEPQSMAWMAGQRGPDRTGARWGEVGTKWPGLEHVMADGGKGRERGVKLANEARSAHAQKPEAVSRQVLTMGLAVFHPQRERERVVQRKWNQAERQLAAASEADARVVKRTQLGRDARGVAGHAWRAWRQAEQLFDEAVPAEGTVPQSASALSWCDAEGRLLSRETAQGHLDEAIKPLQGQPWRKGRRLRSDARTLNHVDRMHEQRTEVVSEPLLRESFIRLWSFGDAMRHAPDADRIRCSHLVVIEQVLCQRLCAQWPSVYEGVDERRRPAVRARSAVEWVKSVVRRHQGRHRHVSQGMLDLNRLSWHCRVFREGKRQGRCPSDLLGLTLPTADWWQLLQMDPEE